MKNKYLMLFANCIITIGKQRAIISDLQKSNYHFIPNSLAGLFNKNDRINVVKLKAKFSNEENEILEEYIEFLLNEELAFYTSSKKECKTYPPLSLEWDYSAKISNIILVLSNKYILDLEKLFSEIDLLNCRHLQIRVYKNTDLDYFYNLINYIKNSSVYSAEMYLQSKFLSNDKLKDILLKNGKIQLFNVFDSSKNEVVFHGEKNEGKLATTTQKFSNKKNCGIINHNYFTVNIEAYTESQNCNSCLNRKLSIGEDGVIKNCPSMKESFGNINDANLSEIVDSDEFKKYWFISKDKIDTCNECEFRHICSDCRAFVDEPDNVYSKPLKCGYNPNTTEWEDWSKSPLKQKAIKFYNL